MFQKELMLTKQVFQKNVCFAIIGFFKDAGFKLEEHACNNCHDLLTMVYGLENIAILSAKEATFGVFCWVLVEMKV